MHRFKHAGVAATLACFTLLAAALQYDPISGTPIVTGPGDDHKAVMISFDERLLLLFERRVGAQNDLYGITSEDDGTTWGVAEEVSVGGSDDRLGSLVELGDGSLTLIYTSNADGVNRVHRATSSDGTTWAKRGAVNLNQSPASPINPHVIVEDDGRLTMVYQLLSGNLYVAQSSDDGATWDEEPTQIGPPWAVSPHITRTGDGRYLLTYHTLSADQSLYAQISESPYAWAGEPITISTSAADRSSFPIRLPDGTLVVFYGHSDEEAPADVYYRASDNGMAWDAPVQVTQAEFSEIMPSAVRAAGRRAVHLLWGQETEPGGDYDIYFQPDLELQPLPTPTWTPSPTATATSPVFMSPTPTPTATPRTPTTTPSHTPTRTLTPTETLTPTPITPTATPTVTPTPSRTPTLMPRLDLTPGSYPVRVSAGEPITITWTLATNRGADLWIEWGTRIAQFDQRYDFPWVPAGIHAFEHVIVAPSRPYLGFRVTAKDDVQSAISWSGQVRVTAHAVYVPMLRR